MKKFILLIPFIVFFITGCTSIPGPVDEQYLADKNANQAAQIKDLEQKIIAKMNEKQALEKKLKDISPRPGLTDDELKLLKKENGLLKDQVDFYTRTKDAVNLESRNSALKDNETAITKKTALYNYQVAEKDLTAAELDVRTYELAVLIAQLNYEKSKIATEYRDKHEVDAQNNSGNFFTDFINRFRKKDPQDKYGYKKYEDYLISQKDELAKSEKKFVDAQTRFQDTKLKQQDANN